MPPVSPEPVPIDLNELLARGMSIGTRRVVRLTLEVDGIGPQTLTLPMPEPEPKDEPSSLTEMEQAVITVIKSTPAGHKLTHQVIADKAGYACSGHMRAFVKQCAEMGLLKPVYNGFEVC